MSKQMKWGLATLMLLLGIAAVFLFIDKDTNTEPKMTLGQPTKDLLNKPIPQPQTHVHKDGTVHQGTHASQTSVQQTQPADTVSDDVIYPHHELLQTHPVAALRAQVEDSGHWSAEHIPPFPPDDEEAASLAYNVYVQIHYEGINDPYNPVVIKAWKKQRAFMDTIFEKYPGLPPGLEKHSVKYTEAELAAQKVIDARRNDLGRLMWPQMENPPPSIHRWSSTFTK